MIAEIEDAIIARIKEVTTVDGVPLVKEAKSIPHNFDVAELAMRLRGAPGIYVCFLGGPAQEETSAAIDADWALYFLAQGAGGEEQRRRGPGGAYQLLRLVIPEVHGMVVEGVGSLSLGAVHNLFNEQLDRLGYSLYSAAFKLPMLFPPLEAKDLLALVHADWTWRRQLAPPGGQGSAESEAPIPQRREGDRHD